MGELTSLNIRWFMNKISAGTLCLTVVLSSTLVGCGEPHYVDNNGTRYYDANGMGVDTTERGPYTKNGEYYVNPTDTTNTRDNRGNLVSGWGHDTNEDYHPAPAPISTNTNTTTVVYPDGQSTTTTVVEPAR